jgi:hypothetical protein
VQYVPDALERAETLASKGTPLAVDEGGDEAH